MCESSHCSTFSPAFVFCSVFGHSRRCVVVSPWVVVWWYLFVLIFISLVTYDVEYLFMCLIGICIFSLLSYLLRSLAHFSVELFSYCWVPRVLCLFWITVLYHMCLYHVISSPCLCCLLTLLTLSFTEKEFLTLPKFSLSIHLKKVSSHPWSSRFSPMLSSRSFIVL